MNAIAVIAQGFQYVWASRIISLEFCDIMAVTPGRKGSIQWSAVTPQISAE